jgi:hypothetical protein
MIRHGELYLRDQVPPRSKYYGRGKFGRLFPTLPPFAKDSRELRQALRDVGALNGPMDAKDPPPPAPNPQSPDNPRITAGFTFLGQFIDHDLTFDPTSSLERQVDPEAIENFRTPAFELDSVYASGRAASPHLYDARSSRVKLLIETVPDTTEDDLPRNSQHTALIGDPRNDENLIVAGLHLAFLKFHNAVVDHLQAQKPPPADVFAEAQRLVRWHYQWIVLHEFLPLTVGDTLVNQILEVEPEVGEERAPRRDPRPGRKVYDWRHEPFIPVEFSVGAYRFGHSQIRPGYRVNPNLAAPIFAAPGATDLSGGKRGPDRFVDWRHFFKTGGNPEVAPQQSRRIDTLLSTPLLTLPFTGPNLPGNPASLAERNLLRHLTFELPSGQDVAKALEETPLTPRELSDLAPFGLDRSTPLWLYILREAENRAAGQHLGPVGGRIVAEVFVGILQGDRQSYLRQDPKWRPTFGPTSGTFGIVDLLKFAGALPIAAGAPAAG